jgi:hypothetical protein
MSPALSALALEIRFHLSGYSPVLSFPLFLEWQANATISSLFSVFMNLYCPGWPWIAFLQFSAFHIVWDDRCVLLCPPIVWNEVLVNFCPGCPQTVIISTSVFQVCRIAGVSHQCLTNSYQFFEFNYVLIVFLPIGSLQFWGRSIKTFNYITRLTLLSYCVSTHSCFVYFDVPLEAHSCQRLLYLLGELMLSLCNSPL